MGSPGWVWYSYSRFRQQQQRPLHPSDKYANQCSSSCLFDACHCHTPQRPKVLSNVFC